MAFPVDAWHLKHPELLALGRELADALCCLEVPGTLEFHATLSRVSPYLEGFYALEGHARGNES